MCLKNMNKNVGYFFIILSVIFAIALAILGYFFHNNKNELETANQKLSELSFEEGATKKLSNDENGYIGIVTVSMSDWIYSKSSDITYQDTPSGNILSTINAELTENKVIVSSDGDYAKLKYNASSNCNEHTFYQIKVGDNTYYICKAINQK